jgi:6-pyruvoyl-tetrahydropterin synthase
MNTNKKHYLTEIFLDVLEKKGNKLGQEFVRKVRTFIKSPDFAELFDFLVTNAVGGRILIKRPVVENAIDYIIKRYEQEIEENVRISDKENAKRQMKTYMHTYKNLLTAFIEANYLFE